MIGGFRGRVFDGVGGLGNISSYFRPPSQQYPLTREDLSPLFVSNISQSPFSYLRPPSQQYTRNHEELNQLFVSIISQSQILRQAV